MIKKLPLLPSQNTVEPRPIEEYLNPYFAKLNEVIDKLNELERMKHDT